MKELAGKTIIVTGAGRGIGRKIAQVLSAKGANLALCARTASELDETASLLNQACENDCFTSAIDITQQPDIMQFIKKTHQEFGQIDGLVNNAAIGGAVGFFEDIEASAWEQVLQVNLMGLINISREVIPYLKKQKSGSIVNFCGAAIGWRDYSSKISAYRVSKYGVYGFTESLAKELEPFKVRMNAILPGSVDTLLGTSLLQQNNSAQQAGSPSAAARLTAYLLSDQSSSITGKLISSNWDNWENWEKSSHAINDPTSPCAMTLRRIDGNNYSAK